MEYRKPDEQVPPPAGLSKNLDPLHQMLISLTSDHIVIIILIVKAGHHVERNTMAAEHIA